MHPLENHSHGATWCWQLLRPLLQTLLLGMGMRVVARKPKSYLNRLSVLLPSILRKMQTEGTHPVTLVLRNMQPGFMDAMMGWIQADLWAEAPGASTLRVAWT